MSTQLSSTGAQQGVKASVADPDLFLTDPVFKTCGRLKKKKTNVVPAEKPHDFMQLDRAFVKYIFK